MTKRKLDPTRIVKTVQLTEQEQQALVGLVTQMQEQAAARPGGTGELIFWQELSDKIMSEEEAAAFLQRLGFEIVEKADG